MIAPNWIGIGVYHSAAYEFADNHFTDNLHYKNEWKNLVSSECKSVP